MVSNEWACQVTESNVNTIWSARTLSAVENTPYGKLWIVKWSFAIIRRRSFLLLTTQMFLKSDFNLQPPYSPKVNKHVRDARHRTTAPNVAQITLGSYCVVDASAEVGHAFGHKQLSTTEKSRRSRRRHWRSEMTSAGQCHYARILYSKIQILLILILITTPTSGSMNFGFKIINNILMLPKFIKPGFKRVNCIRQDNMVR